MIVLDACAAFAMVSGAAEGVGMRELLLEGEPIAAPTLLKYELLNVVRKYVDAGLLSCQAAVEWYRGGIALVDEFHDLDDMAAEILSESVRLGHPAYDVAYLVLARRLGATLYTLDARLEQACIASGVNCLGIDSLQ